MKEFSTAAVNFLNGDGSTAELCRNMVAVMYSGTQPTAGTNLSGADSAATGTAMVAFTKSAGVLTREVRATAVIDFASTTGNCTVLTVGGVSIISQTATYSTPTTLAAALALDINRTLGYPNYSATSNAAVLTIYAPKNSGASLNGLAVVCTVAAGTCAINAADADNLGQAVTAGAQKVGVAAVNGLSIVYPPVAGSSTKVVADIWQGLGGSANINTALGLSTGFAGFTTGTLTAGWIRFYMNPADPEINNNPVGTADTGLIYPRFDCAASDMTVTGGTAIAFGATHTIDTFTVATADTAA